MLTGNKWCFLCGPLWPSLTDQTQEDNILGGTEGQKLGVPSSPLSETVQEVLHHVHTEVRSEDPPATVLTWKHLGSPAGPVIHPQP